MKWFSGFLFGLFFGIIIVGLLKECSKDEIDPHYLTWECQVLTNCVLCKRNFETSRMILESYEHQFRLEDMLQEEKCQSN